MHNFNDANHDTSSGRACHVVTRLASYILTRCFHLRRNNLSRWTLLLRLNHFLLSLASSHQGPVPCGHGYGMAPRGIHLCSLPLLPGRKWICGGEGPGVLRTLLRAVPRPHLRPLPAEDSGGEFKKPRGCYSLPASTCTEKSSFTNTINTIHCSSSLKGIKQRLAA